MDSQPVLRHFGGTKKRAVEVYQRFVEAGVGQKSQTEYYKAAEGRLLGGEDFLDEIKHRIGEHRPQQRLPKPISIDELLGAAEKASGLRRKEFCGNSKTRRALTIREAVIELGRERGIRNRGLAFALGIDPSSVTRRLEAVRSRREETAEMAKLRRALESGGR